MLIGEYYHNLDTKGRVSIPSKFRDDLGGTFVLSKGLDDCLYAYSVMEWEGFQRDLLELRGKDAQKVRRFFFSGASECEIDSQGRVVIPPVFREYAGLKKELVIIGNSNRAEIWDKEKWTKYISDSSFDSEEIAEAMERLGL
ncbi:MAG: division/cell wall cluster transcriptional repressor MraZ [Clostridia bacterium]|nr:division/cell wall cluster transcriptional repressor MraZ [Clostridia bacterium]